ncbi:unnamed protein product [Cunninghamella echinulata]
MKFSLFTISAVALCLLQQSQASPLGLTEPVTGLLGGVTGAPGQAVTGTPGQAVTGKVTPGEGNNAAIDGKSGGSINGPTGGEDRDDDGEDSDKKIGSNGDLSAAKRGLPLGLDGIVGGLLKTVDGLLETVDGLLKGITGSTGLLDIDGLLDLGLGKLVSGLVDTVRTLLDNGGLVGELLNTVTDLLDTVLSILESLGLGDLGGLDALVEELLGLTGGISKRDVTSGVGGGNLKALKLTDVKGLLEQVKALISQNGLGGILKPVLDIVNCLLDSLTKGGATKGGATGVAGLRRALIKRTIERRAAL